MHKLILVLCLMCCKATGLYTYAQKTAKDFKPLGLKQKIPATSFANVLNTSTGTINLNQYKGKLVIFDFWSHRCGSCIKSFPKLDSLQRKYNDQIQIVLVNQESKLATQAFLEKRKKIYVPGLPMITEDRVLHKLFPHQGVPAVTWLNKSGAFIGYSTGDHLTSRNIERVSASNELKYYGDLSKNIYATSLFNDEWKQDVVYSSYIARCINQGTMHVVGDSSKNHISSYYCLSIEELYQLAFSESDNYMFKYNRPGRTVLEIPDSLKFFYSKPEGDLLGENWMENHSYYYQLSLPNNNKHKLYEIFREDLTRYFDLKASIETRMLKSLVLIRSSTNDKLSTPIALPTGINVEKRQFRPMDESDTDMDSVRGFYNRPFSELVLSLDMLIQFYNKIPFVDETGYTGNVYMEFPAIALDNFSVEAIKKELHRYDLDLVEKELPTEILVLRREPH